MAYTVLDQATWEHGEDEPGFENTGSGSFAPVAQEVVSTGDVDDGTYCRRIEFASNDAYIFGNDSARFDRAAVGTPMLAQWVLRVESLAVFDRARLFIITALSGVDSYLAVDIATNGAITVGLTSSINGNVTSAIATSAAGVVPEDAKATITLRVVVDNSAGEVQVRVNGVTVIDETGVDTLGGSGTLLTPWGAGGNFDCLSSFSPNREMRLCNNTWAVDGAMGDMPEYRYQGYAPDGITADNDGSLFGGASDAADATDEVPGTSSDGFTLDASSDRQGLTFPTPAESNVDAVLLYGQVGDSSAGTEEVVIEYSDGVSTDTSAAIPMTNDFGARLLHIVESPPGAASFDAAAADHVFTLERTA